MFSTVKLYLTENPNKKLIFSTVYNGKCIGKWLQHQRINYKQGKVLKEHYQQLLELGIDLAKEGSLM